jgi:hypothetical protein
MSLEKWQAKNSGRAPQRDVKKRMLRVTYPAAKRKSLHPSSLILPPFFASDGQRPPLQQASLTTAKLNSEIEFAPIVAAQTHC